MKKIIIAIYIVIGAFALIYFSINWFQTFECYPMESPIKRILIGAATTMGVYIPIVLSLKNRSING